VSESAIARQRTQFAKQRHRLRRERHNVFTLHLHPFGRYTPQGLISFDIFKFGPSRPTPG
jgi:hypothetical protein